MDDDCLEPYDTHTAKICIVFIAYTKLSNRIEINISKILYFSVLQSTNVSNDSFKSHTF